VEQVQEAVADAPVRALVRLASGGELIYPIGKRTTIGRTADNDIQIDVPNVSRHHAVLLANPRNCRIEDLNSTNGVMVNGQRVTRQELRDGDTVTIGKSEFRFMQRS
jgi:pSer/pThr/pTyr-binding forkhead associated (FHA) protein